MKPHTWVIETVDAPPIDEGIEFWHCTGCGASGGPVFVHDKPTWAPFLAGEGHTLKLSEDCDETVEIIRQHTFRILKKMEKRKDGLQHFASLMKDAMNWTPEKRSVIQVYRLYQEMRNPATRSFTALRHKLQEAGFNTMHRGLADAVCAIAETIREEERNAPEDE